MTSKLCEFHNDHFQNYKKYNVKKAQLVIADIPYNIGANAYASNPMWWEGRDNKKGASKLANKQFFDTDKNFKIDEFMHFCSKMLIKEPEGVNKAPAMIVFCAFQQLNEVMECGKKYGLKKNYPLVFIKPNSSQALKANMKIVGATEYAVVLYRDKLPKFNNPKTVLPDGTIKGTMIKNWFNFGKDDKKIYPKIHPTQKPICLLKELISIFTDVGDVVIDPCAGSGSTLRASYELGRYAIGFEIKKDIYAKAKEEMLSGIIK